MPRSQTEDRVIRRVTATIVDPTHLEFREELSAQPGGSIEIAIPASAADNGRSKTQAERFAAEVEKESNEEVRHMVITWEDALADSKAKGEAKGKTEGKAEATRSHILRILQRRLESVPAFVREKVDSIQNLERLEDILDQAIVVRSIDELVLEP